MAKKAAKKETKKAQAEKPTLKVTPEAQAVIETLAADLKAQAAQAEAEVVQATTEEISAPVADSACIPQAEAGDSMQEPTPVGNSGEKIMLTFKALDKRNRNAIYTGARVSLRIPVSAFPDSTPPQTLNWDGLAGPKEKKAPETPEERKARLAARPKPTLADKIAKQEARLAALRQQAESEQVAQPAL